MNNLIFSKTKIGAKQRLKVYIYVYVYDVYYLVYILPLTASVTAKAKGTLSLERPAWGSDSSTSSTYFCWIRRPMLRRSVALGRMSAVAFATTTAGPSRPKDLVPPT